MIVRTAPTRPAGMVFLRTACDFLQLNLFGTAGHCRLLQQHMVSTNATEAKVEFWVWVELGGDEPFWVVDHATLNRVEGGGYQHVVEGACIA